MELPMNVKSLTVSFANISAVSIWFD